MSNRAIIITCGSEKALTKSRAEKMYVSGYFRQCLSWAKSKIGPDRIFIISAKYGLLRLDDMIAPYELRMGQPGSVSPLIISKQAEAMGILDAEIVSTAGVDYQKVLNQVFKNISYPFEGMTIGYRAGAMRKDKKKC